MTPVSDTRGTHGPDESDRPFFIIGSGRSGSSLLGRMLNSHPRLAVPDESHLFRTFYHHLKYYGNLEKRSNREQLVDDILSSFPLQNWSPPPNRERFLAQIRVPTFAGIMDAMMSSWAHDQGKQRWGEKTPQHTFYWREILECFPDARFIHIVRDGRDVADSYMRARFGAKTMYMGARRWARWLEQIEELRQVVESRQFLEVRYEDILAEPEFELTKICDYLGESFSSKMLEFHKVEVSDKVTDNSNRRNLRSPLLTDNAQKWRKRYSKSQLRIFASVAQATLIRHNYETVFESKPTLSFYQHFYHRAIENPIYKWPAMIANRRGILGTWSRLKILVRLRWRGYFRR
jgi:hypothetical protein